MTQSGQGEEPSPRVAREGIVLPSDGGEPLLPGMTGGSGGQGPGNGQGGGAYGGQPASAPAPAPTGGQAWGQPWGPGPDMNHPEPQPHAQPPAPDAQQHQQHQQWGAQGQFHPQPQPQHEHYQQPQSQAAAPAPEWHNDPRASGGWGQQGHDGHDGHGGYGGYGAQPNSGAPLPVPYAAHGAESAPLPPAAGGTPMPQQPEQQAHQPYGQPQPQHPDVYGQYGGAPSAPLPPEGGAAVPYAAAPGAPLPPADEGATQYLPPVQAAPGPVVDQATQYLPPVAAETPAPAHVNEAATQYIPPVRPGALPPEMPAEATTFLSRVPQAPSAPAASVGSDAEATQYIPPVPGGSYGVRPGGPDDRQPPSDFDNLFRSTPGGHGAPGAEAPAGATQQLPRIQPQQSAPSVPSPSYGQQAPYAPQQASYGFAGGPQDMDERHGGGRGGGGRRSRVPVIAAVGIGIAVLGIGAGALMSSGGGDSEQDAGNKTVAATSAAPEESGSSPAADPAEAQAVELDKLLADSNDSRDAVIKAVANVKACKNLGQAATDLRDAAQQRGELVTRLSALAVDKLPNNAELTTALTKAWQASQSADNHYAAWADQVAGKKGCRKGQARTTGQTQSGNLQSGIATTQKAKAAELWNAIAKTYGLTERQSTQL